MGKIDRKFTPVQIQVTLGLIFYFFILAMILGAVGITLTYAMEESSFRLGFLDTMKSAGSLLMLFPLVKLSDRLGRKWTLFIFLFLNLIGFLIFFLSTQYWMWIIARILMGMNSIMGVFSALTCDHFSEEKRGAPLSLISIGGVLGFLAGSLIGEYIYTWLGDPKSFLFLGLLTCMGFIVILIFIKDVPFSERIGHSQVQRGIELGTWKFIMKDKRFIALLIIYFIINIIMSGSTVFIVYIFFYHLKLGTVGGLFIIPCQIAQTLTYLILGIKGKNFVKFYKFLIVMAGILLSIVLSLYFFDQNEYLFAASTIVGGIIYAGFMQSTDSISHKLIPKEHKTNMVSIYRIVGLIGSIVGPSIIMFQVQYIWTYAPGIFMVITQVIILILYFTLVREKQYPPS